MPDFKQHKLKKKTPCAGCGKIFAKKTKMTFYRPLGGKKLPFCKECAQIRMDAIAQDEKEADPLLISELKKSKHEYDTDRKVTCGECLLFIGCDKNTAGSDPACKDFREDV